MYISVPVAKVRYMDISDSFPAETYTYMSLVISGTSGTVKMRDWKMRDQQVGVENARSDKAEPKLQDPLSRETLHFKPNIVSLITVSALKPCLEFG